MSRQCVGTQQSMSQALGSTRVGGHMSYVGVPHGVSFDGQQIFFRLVHQHGGPAPVHRFMPKLMDLVVGGRIDPGAVFDLALPLDKVAEGYRAIKALLQP